MKAADLFVGARKIKAGRERRSARSSSAPHAENGRPLSRTFVLNLLRTVGPVTKRITASCRIRKVCRHGARLAASPDWPSSNPFTFERFGGGTTSPNAGGRLHVKPKILTSPTRQHFHHCGVSSKKFPRALMIVIGLEKSPPRPGSSARYQPASTQASIYGTEFCAANNIFLIRRNNRIQGELIRRESGWVCGENFDCALPMQRFLSILN